VTVKGNVTVNRGNTLGIGEETTVKGNVTGGGDLEIGEEATVEGDVTVDPGGRLITGTALITGNVQSTDAAIIRMEGATTVGGNLRLKETDEPSAVRRFIRTFVSGGTVNGNMELDDGRSVAFVENENVGGNLQILNNNSSTMGIESSTSDLEVRASTVGGNLEVADNLFNSIYSNALAVRETFVANNLLVYNNSLSTGLLGSVLRVEGNLVGGSAELLNNTFAPSEGQVSLPSTVVSTNLVATNLICTGNEPPPTDPLGANIARKKLGQCEPL
jgi:hypothetical protein